MSVWFAEGVGMEERYEVVDCAEGLGDFEEEEVVPMVRARVRMLEL